MIPRVPKARASGKAKVQERAHKRQKDEEVRGRRDRTVYVAAMRRNQVNRNNQMSHTS